MSHPLIERGLRFKPAALAVRSAACRVVGLGMVPVRPTRRDDLTGSHSPVAVARQVRDHAATSRQGAVTHGHAAVAFYTAGRSRVQQNGEWNVREGDVLLVPAGAPHRMVEMRRPES